MDDVAICRWAAAPLVGGGELLHLARAALPAGVLTPLLVEALRHLGVPVVLLVAGGIVVVCALVARSLSKDPSGQVPPFEISRVCEEPSQYAFGSDVPPVVQGDDGDDR